MSAPAVLIAAGELLPALKARLAAEHDLLAFADSDALRALEVITTRRPALVFLDHRFASTPRGTALVNRISADPSLSETRVRIVPPDGAPVELAGPAPVDIEVIDAEAPAARTREVAVVASPQLLDHTGTRRVPRFPVAGDPEIVVDGNRGTLVDVGALGAQIVTQTVLKPNQRVRVSLSDTEGTVRCTATIVWATFEIPKGAGPRYRAGLEFIDADALAVEAYARRHAPG